jgi:transmembrane sensor
MHDKDLKILLEKYRKGECTQDEINFIHDWFDSLEAGEDLQLNELEKSRIEAKIWQNMQSDLQESGWKTKSARMVYLRFLAGAAAMFLLIAGLGIFRKEGTAFFAEYLLKRETEMIREVNSSDQLKKLVLNDGSVVTLTPRSALTYPKEFADDEREVTLEGDAFFEIAKNPERPFVVMKDKLVTRVLGTSFWIRTDKNAGTSEVSVVTGKVAVFEKKLTEADSLSENSVLLVPNEKVVYNSRSGEILRSPVEVKLSRSEVAQVRELVADNLPLPEILDMFGVLYGIHVEIVQPGLAQCTFTGDLRNMQFYDALELLCKSVNATYESVEGRIEMIGDGCR